MAGRLSGLEAMRFGVCGGSYVEVLQFLLSFAVNLKLPSTTKTKTVPPETERYEKALETTSWECSGLGMLVYPRSPLEGSFAVSAFPH